MKTSPTSPVLLSAVDNALRLLAQIQQQAGTAQPSAIRELARDAAAPLKHALRAAILSD